MATYRRRNFLIDQRFQIRFTLYVCSWILALSLAYPWIIYSLFNYFMELAAFDPLGPTLKTLKETRTGLMQTLVGMQFGYMGIIFLLSIFLSHRVAGPLFKLKRAFEDVVAGKPITNITFRKADHFHELADSYNQLMNRFQLHLTQNAELAANGAARLEKAIGRVGGQLSPSDKKDLMEVAAMLQSLSKQVSSQ